MFLFVSWVTYYSLFISQMPRKRYILITFASAKNAILHYQYIYCYIVILLFYNYMKLCIKALGSLDWVLFSAVCGHSFVNDVSVLCSLSAFHLLVVFWLTKQKLLMIWIQPCQRMPHYALMQLQATIIQRQVHVLHCLCIYIPVCIILKVNIQNEITIWSNSHT